MTYMTITVPVPKRNVPAINTIQSVFILPFLFQNLSFPSMKNPWLNTGHGFSKIPFASATRLSQEDPWLSVPRLLVVWLYRRIWPI